MRKLLLVAQQRVLYAIQRWSYWVSFFAPIWMSVIWVLVTSGVSLLSNLAPRDLTLPMPDIVRIEWQAYTEVVGYVDEAHLLHRIPPEQVAWFKPFATEAEAQEAARAGQIGGYYRIPPDYVAGAPVTYHAKNITLLLGTDEVFKTLLIANLMDVQRDDLAWRVAEPARFDELQVSPTTTLGDTAPPEFVVRGVYSPMQAVFAVGALFTLLWIFSSVGAYCVLYMLDEQERGMLEILLSSVSATDFVLGKLLGTLALMAFEMVWPLTFVTLAGGGAWLLTQASPAFMAEASGWFTSFTAGALLALVLSGVLAYSALLVTAGTLAVKPVAANAIAGVFYLCVLAQVLLVFRALSVPDHPAIVGLSLIPLFAPAVMSTRLVVSAVPLWQVLLSVAGLWGMAGGALWAAVRLFQLRRQWGDFSWSGWYWQARRAVARFRGKSDKSAHPAGR